ncbi:MAG TPA: hypothetical protein VMW09_04925 [Desulfatiglandales bacterium]|nr:hypothetical protein [Desulfatiglandales bacterium]
MKIEKNDLVESIIHGIDYFPEFKEGSKEPLEALIKDWFEGTVHLLSELERRGFGGLIEKNYDPFGDPRAILAIYRRIFNRKQGDRECSKYFKPAPELKDNLPKYLAQVCDEGNFSIELGQNAKLIRMLNEKFEFNWQPLLNSLQKRLPAGTGTSAEEVRGCLILLIELGFHYKEDIVKGLVDTGQIAQLLSRSDIQNDYLTAALCIFLHYMYLPDGNLAHQQPGSTSGINIYLKFCQDLSGKGKLFQGVIHAAGRYHAEINFVKKLVNANAGQITAYIVDYMLVKNIEKEDIFIYDEYIVNYNCIARVLHKPTHERIVNHYAHDNNFLEYLINNPFELDEVKMYTAIYKIKTFKSNSRYVKFIKNGIGGLGSDQLFMQIRDFGIIMELLISMLQRKVSFESEILYEPLDKYAEFLVDTGQMKGGEIYQDNWGLLIGCMIKEHKNSLSRSIIEKMRESKEKDFTQMLLLYGDMMSEAEYIKGEAEEYINTIYHEIIKRKNNNEIEWFVKMLKNEYIFYKAKNLDTSYISIVGQIKVTRESGVDGRTVQLFNEIEGGIRTLMSKRAKQEADDQ